MDLHLISQTSFLSSIHTHMHSLVPRPSHCPVFLFFLSLAVCKNRGGRPVPFYHMNDISVYLGTQRGGRPIERTHFMHMFFVLNQEQYIFRLGQKLQDKTSNSFFQWRPLPPLST